MSSFSELNVRFMLRYFFCMTLDPSVALEQNEKEVS